MPITYTHSKIRSKSNILTPAGDGLIDVTGNYQWTTSNNRGEVPSVTLTEYQQNSGQLLAGLYFYAKQGARVLGTVDGEQGDTNPYEYLYFADPTGFSYKFPYLSSAKHSRNTTFSTQQEDNPAKALGDFVTNSFTLSTGTRGGKKLLNKIGAGLLAGKAGVGLINAAITGKIRILQSQSWTNTTENNVDVTFDLINSFNNTNEIIKNRELAYLLTYQNSPYRRNFAITDPTVIYTLSIPDVISMPACYMASLNVENLGNVRLLQIDGQQRTIPEAYRITMSFASLLEASRNIFAGVDNQSDIITAVDERDALTAIRDGLAISDRLENAIPGSRDFLNGLESNADNAVGGRVNNFAQELTTFR